MTFKCAAYAALRMVQLAGHDSIVVEPKAGSIH